MDLIFESIKSIQKIRDFLLSSGLRNHREHRVHREKGQSSVFSVDSVVDLPRNETFLQNKLKSFKNNTIKRIYPGSCQTS